MNFEPCINYELETDATAEILFILGLDSFENSHAFRTEIEQSTCINICISIRVIIGIKLFLAVSVASKQASLN